MVWGGFWLAVTVCRRVVSSQVMGGVREKVSGRRGQGEGRQMLNAEASHG
jgi:hypothetical protein